MANAAAGRMSANMIARQIADQPHRSAMRLSARGQELHAHVVRDNQRRGHPFWNYLSETRRRREMLAAKCRQRRHEHLAMNYVSGES